MAYGFIYFLDNPAMPGLVKIGYTSRHPQERVNELSAATSCPIEFRLLGWFGHSDARWAEGEIHKELDGFRYSNNREFFTLTLEEVRETMRRWGDSVIDAFVDADLNYLIDEKNGVVR